MTTIEIKRKLIRRINKINDDLLLQEMSHLIDFSMDESDVYQFTEEENRAVEEAQEGYAKGNFLTEEEANKEVDKWLEE